jgi:hypothetical protein
MPVHILATDDPVGIENYWHERCKKEGKWILPISLMVVAIPWPVGTHPPEVCSSALGPLIPGNRG